MTTRDRERVAADLAERYAAGASIRQLARSSGLSYSTVRSLLIERGVTIRSPGGCSAVTYPDTV